MRRSLDLRGMIDRFLSVPVSDPDDARRRRLLNIILAGVELSSLVAVVVLLISSWVGIQATTSEENLLIIGSAAVLFLGALGFYFLNRNRRIPGWVVSFIFLIFLLASLVFTDTPTELTNGRSTFVYVIPLVMASVLLQPIFSFVFAFLGGLEIFILSQAFGTETNYFAIVGLFLIALVVWLSSRSLAQTLAELRQINFELDRRVEERTRELSAALARELEEAGRSQAILDGIGDGVAVFDTEGMSIVANPALSALLEIPLGDLKRVSMTAILQQTKSALQDRDAVLSMLANPQVNLPSVRLRSGNRTLLVNAAQVHTGLGDAIGTVAVFRDFTREAEVEQMKNAFVGMVSHELRTPLNAIIGYAEMMREKVYGPIAARQSEIMSRIENSGKRLLSLVSDLLDQAQIEAGKMKIHNEPLKVTDLTEALFALEKQVADKSLTLATKIDARMPAEVVGDARRLQQILINLVGNAVKFMDRGEINVRIYPVDAMRWGIQVADNGPGIPAEAQQYVFDSFRQVEGVTTREHGGIGLGLAIVKSLVGLMSGEINLWSEVGKGTTFSVTLPYHPTTEAK